MGAAFQRDGAVLLHMNSAKGASWVKANMDAFLAAMGGTSFYKERLLNVVVQFVPVLFDPSRDGALHVVEGDNNMPVGDLAKARWIKPADQRHAGQRVAHAVFGFKAASTANTFLRN
ncbi:hypothetical protein B0H19DRAFT_923461, partial [Mycena capillaripes]